MIWHSLSKDSSLPLPPSQIAFITHRIYTNLRISPRRVGVQVPPFALSAMATLMLISGALILLVEHSVCKSPASKTIAKCWNVGDFGQLCWLDWLPASATENECTTQCLISILGDQFNDVRTIRSPKVARKIDAFPCTFKNSTEFTDPAVYVTRALIIHVDSLVLWYMQVLFCIQICWWALHTIATCERMHWVQFAISRRTVTAMLGDRGPRLDRKSFITELNAL